MTQELLEFSYVCGYPVFGSEKPDDRIVDFQNALSDSARVVQSSMDSSRMEVQKLNRIFHVDGVRDVDDSSGKFDDSKVVTITYHSGKKVDLLVPSRAIHTY